MARGRRAPVKAFLLDQRRIAGVGNIYADEALFRARIHPLRPAGTLTRAQCDALAQTVREALLAGLAAGGATIDDFRHADGVQGAFQNEFLVHLRRGEPCVRCGDARWSSSSPPGAAPTSASAASRARGAGALGGLRGELGQPAALVGLHELLEAADVDLADDDLREAQHPGLLDQLRASGRVLCEIDLLELELADLQQLLGALAERARLGRVDGDLGHYFTKYSEGLVPGPLKVQGVILRSLRYGEADRILHLYTPQRGKVGAIAKGVRRARSRFGGRMEPFFRLNLILHEGRSDLLTVTAAETVDGYPRLREHGGALDTAARACDAVSRLFDTSEPHPGVFHLLCNELALLDSQPDACRARQPARLPPEAPAGRRPGAAAGRVRLVRRARAPQRLLGRRGRRGLPGLRGGLVPAGRGGARVPGRRHRPAAGRDAAADARALRQAERAIADTLEHHAGIRWRQAVAR